MEAEAEKPVGATELAVTVYVPATGAVQSLPEKAPPDALQLTEVSAEPRVEAVKWTTSPVVTMGPELVFGVVTEREPCLTVRFCETESPARLVTRRV